MDNLEDEPPALVEDPVIAEDGEEGEGEGEEEGYMDASEEAKLEAKTLRHLMTQYPKNRFCPSCRTAKIKLGRYVRKKGAGLGRPPKTSGEQITLDVIMSYTDTS